MVTYTQWESVAAKKESNFLVAIWTGGRTPSSRAISGTQVFNSRYLFAIALTVAAFALDFATSGAFATSSCWATLFDDEHFFCDFTRLIASVCKVSLDWSHAIAATVAEVETARRSRQKSSLMIRKLWDKYSSFLISYLLFMPHTIHQLHHQVPLSAAGLLEPR